MLLIAPIYMTGITNIINHHSAILMDICNSLTVRIMSAYTRHHFILFIYQNYIDHRLLVYNLLYSLVYFINSIILISLLSIGIHLRIKMSIRVAFLSCWYSMQCSRRCFTIRQVLYFSGSRFVVGRNVHR